jgi:hypothetical protein
MSQPEFKREYPEHKAEALPLEPSRLHLQSVLSTRDYVIFYTH